MQSDLEALAGVEMPCITLWQPFASLIFATNADGEFIKKHETRSFRLPDRLLGQRIAIHAAKAFPAWKHISEELHDLCLDVFGCQYNETLPKGGLLGSVRVAACALTINCSIDADDFHAGDWSAGRFAWRLEDPQPIDGGRSYRPWKGKQGWFRVPAAALRARSFLQNEEAK